MKNNKHVQSFNEHIEKSNNHIDNINEGIFDMYTMNGIMDKLSREENNGEKATIIDKDHKKNVFRESYIIYFRFDDGYEDQMNITSDKYNRLDVGDEITINY